MQRKRFGAEQWAAWFEEFEGGDHTVEQFCRSKGTSANTFYKWRKRLESAASNSATFVSVHVPQVLIEIELPSQAVARIPNDRESLRPLLELLCELGAKS